MNLIPNSADHVPFWVRLGIHPTPSYVLVSEAVITLSLRNLRKARLMQKAPIGNNLDKERFDRLGKTNRCVL